MRRPKQPASASPMIVPIGWRSLCSAAIVVVELTELGNAIAGVKVSEVGKGVERKILVLLFESKRGE